MALYKTLVKKISIPADKKTKQKEYLSKGDLPIIDQGHALIGGYSDDRSKKIECVYPVIIFGDHTKCVKLIGFPFGAGADGIKILQPKEGVSAKYLYYGTQYLTLKIEDRGYARHYQHIEKEHLALPSLPEQDHIVSRIEELFSQLDNGVETLKTIKHHLVVYRQSVMKQAFEGKLTQEWRSNLDCYEKSDLVELSRCKRDEISHANNMKKLKYSYPEDIETYSIPVDWEFAQIGDIAWSIKDGPHYSPKYVDEGIPFITGGNVRPWGVDFTSAKKISQELHRELCKRCNPQKGDMLYTKGGTTGIARVNTYDFPFSVWVHVAVIKFVDTVLPEYFQHVLNSPFCYWQSQKYTHGVGNQDLGLTRMINIIFPICSLDEQKEIVRQIEMYLSVCDSIEQTVDKAMLQAEALRQSILKEAFEGRLI
ncbi:MAG: restriction endonuclease subunit S [Eubacteriales bacterium]|nr:restriction endonuclease subunit S [Eubacteriales bacterium]